MVESGSFAWYIDSLANIDFEYAWTGVGIIHAFLSILTLISFGDPVEWWISSKTAFSSDFVKYADERLSTDSFQNPIHPGMNND